LVLITGALLAIFVDLGAVAAELQAAKVRYLWAASAALLAGLALYALGWRWLMGNQPRLGLVWHAANVGHAANIVLPLRLGEAARVALLARAGAVTAGGAASSVVVERLLIQVMRMAALGGAVVFGVGLPVSPATVGGAAAFLAAAFGAILLLRRARPSILRRGPALVARLPRLTEAGARSMLTNLLDGLDVAATPGRLAAAMALTVGSWVCFWGFHALVLLALPQAFSVEQLLAMSLGALALAPPSAPTQPGVYHASLVAPLVVVGFSETTLTAFAVLLHALMMAWMLGLAALGLVLLRRTPAPSVPLPQAPAISPAQD
jgi:hypothetical protein